MFGKKNDASDPAARQQEVLKALGTVMVPNQNKDLVSLGAVKNLTIADDEVGFTVELPAPPEPVKIHVKSQAEAAVRALPWPSNVVCTVVAAAPQAAGPQVNEGSAIRNIIAVASGKGGVGKSTVATNLAFALQRGGAKVGLMDADIYGPSVPHMLGLADEKPNSAMVGGKQRLVPVENRDLKIMSMGFLVDPEKPVIWRGPMVHGAVQQFFRDVLWGELDYLVIDLPPGTGDVQLTMVQQVPITGAVVVTTPQDVAMIDARKAFNMFGDTNVPVLGIVENMSQFTCPHCGEASHIFGHDGARAWAEEQKTRFLGAIPIDISIRVAGDGGTPAVAAEGTDEKVVAAFNGVADAVMEELANRPGPEGKLELQL